MPSRIPETESDSSISADMSARLTLAHGGDPPPLLADAPREPDEERQQPERCQGEAPVEQEHRRRRGDHGGDVGDDRGRGRGDDALHAADVVGDPRLDLAGARAGEEGKREPLEVAVYGGAQVVHDPLADRVREQRLGDAEGAGRDRDRDHPDDQLGEQGRVLVRDRVVENAPQQERRDHPEPRGEADQRQNRGEPAAVGAKELEHPLALGGAHVGSSLPCARSSAAPRIVWRAAGDHGHPLEQLLELAPLGRVERIEHRPLDLRGRRAGALERRLASSESSSR